MSPVAVSRHGCVTLVVDVILDVECGLRLAVDTPASHCPIDVQVAFAARTGGVSCYNVERLKESHECTFLNTLCRVRYILRYRTMCSWGSNTYSR